MDEPRYQPVSEVRRDGIALGLVAAMLVAGAIALPHLPARVPIHWNVAGQVNGWAAPTMAAFLSPTMALGIWALLLLAPTIDPRRSAYASFAATYRLIRHLVVAVIAAVDAVVLGSALGVRISVPVVTTLLVSALLFVVGNVLPRVRPTWFVGVRTPWTLTNDEVWRRTQRFAGRLYVLAALVVLPGLVGGPRVLAFLVAAAAILPALAATVYSYLLYQRLAAGGGAGRG
jgi:uncharacterized membrane protein